MFFRCSWVAPGAREAAVELLARHDAAWVCVDAPRLDVASAMPAGVERTSDALGYVRLHGRNAATWTTGRIGPRFVQDLPTVDVPVLAWRSQRGECRRGREKTVRHTAAEWHEATPLGRFSRPGQ
jgi:hypothetical protein